MREGPNAAAGDLILLHSARQLITLHGSPGLRTGPEMRNLAIIPDGAVLIRNGVIEDVGPTRRVANLLRAKRARELDATGRIVLPAFVDSDALLVTQALSAGQKVRMEKSAESSPVVESLRVMSKRRMEMRSTAMAHALASYGVLTTGSSTSSADDPRNVNRILTVHKTLEGAPLRIRSVLAWPAGGLRPSADQETDLGEWLNTIRAPSCRMLSPNVWATAWANSPNSFADGSQAREGLVLAGAGMPAPSAHRGEPPVSTKSSAIPFAAATRATWSHGCQAPAGYAAGSVASKRGRCVDCQSGAIFAQ